MISADKLVVRVLPGVPFTATNGPGWFVPDARMIEIMEQLDRLKMQNAH